MGRRPLPDPRSSMWAWAAYSLRQYRIRMELTGTQMGSIMGVERSAVSKLEYGDVRLSEEQARAIDQHGNTGEFFEVLVWYARLGHDPDWLGENFKLEAKSLVIRIFHGGFVPGLLQTPEYARASMIAGGVTDLDGEVEKRLTRQEILNRANPPEIWALIDQAALDRPGGGREVMTAQLRFLLELEERSNIGLRVVPRSTGLHTGLDGTFKLMTLPSGDVGFMEACVGGRLISDASEVRSLVTRWERIGHQALPADASRALIQQIIKEMAP